MKIPSFAIVASTMILPLANAADLRSSRLIAPEQVEQRIDSFSSKLAINERTTDPFGQRQDTKAPTMTTSDEGDRGDIAKVKVPLGDVVATIAVVAVSPKDGRIISGGRPYCIGQKLEVPYKGVKYEVELKAVAQQEIEFENVKTGEAATLKFKGAVNNPLQKDDW